MKHLVVDPCLVVPDEQWDAFNDNLSWNIGAELKQEFVTKDGLKVVGIESTANGDGDCRVNGKEIGTDTGTIAVVEVPDDFTVQDGILVDSLEEAQSIMREAASLI